MELFTPDFGLVFWMFVAFMVLFIALSIWGWPVIVKSMNSRAETIDNGIEYARQAKQQLDEARAESQKYVAEAQKQQADILREAAKMKTQIIEQARDEAAKEAKKVMDAARVSIEQSQKQAEAQLRDQVSQYSIAIAEKMLRKQLASPNEQSAYAAKLMDEMEMPESKTK